MKQSMEDHRHGNLDSILALADGGVSHADVNYEGYSSWTQRLRPAMLPKWWQSDGDVVTTQNIKLAGREIGLNLEHFVGGENLLDDAGNQQRIPEPSLQYVLSSARRTRR